MRTNKVCTCEGYAWIKDVCPLSRRVRNTHFSLLLTIWWWCPHHHSLGDQELGVSVPKFISIKQFICIEWSFCRSYARQALLMAAISTSRFTIRLDRMPGTLLKELQSQPTHRNPKYSDGKTMTPSLLGSSFLNIEVIIALLYWLEFSRWFQICN